MTDLGSVLFEPDRPADTSNTSHGQNGRLQHFHPARVPLKRCRNLPRQPSTILESVENNMLDSGIDVVTGNQTVGSSEDVSQLTTESLDQANLQALENQSSGEENIRNSLCSDGDFGSNDILADNDSLENDRIGYHNVVAEVTVHTDSDRLPAEQSSSDAGSDADKTLESDVSGSGRNDTCLPHVNGEQTKQVTEPEIKALEKNTSESSSTVKVEEIEFIDGVHDDINHDNSVSIEEIEKQIITDDSNLKGNNQSVALSNYTESKCNNTVIDQEMETANTYSVNGAYKMDLNRNPGKSNVRFKEQSDGEIQEEHIESAEAVPVEGTPPKKDALAKRETWASRKLKKTFGFRGDKYEEEDQVDGRGNVSYYVGYTVACCFRSRIVLGSFR